MNSKQSENLSAKRCTACEGGVDRLAPEQAEELLRTVSGWRLTHNGLRIRKDWHLKNFLSGIDFFTKVANLAEQEGHHPDLHLEAYRDVWIEIWTHAIGGLSQNDFILAAKIDELPVKVRTQ
jgi:4a-hydroxytetrahydrobiopterin dehydratase